MTRRLLVVERLEERFLLTAAPTLTSLSASAASVAFGQSVTLTATVIVAPPNTGTPTGGTVTFLNGSSPLGTAPLNSGTATLQVSTLPAGTDVVLASYGGNSNFAASGTVVGPNSVITTVAGNGNSTYYGDENPATAAGLDQPPGVAVDSAGDLFIVDTGNVRIREVNLATGLITTVAGNGTSGYGGDNGPATAAELYQPMGVAVDTAGNLFIADTGNDRIREVNLSTGVITTVAGGGNLGLGDNGPATAAELYDPYGIAVDAAGDLFVADEGNGRVREVNQATGVITTVAGNGTAGYSGDNGLATAAELRAPSGVAVDAAGDLFIADTYNYRIREVDHATGLITTVAGNGTAGSSGDNGLATAAELRAPSGVAVDAAGDLFIADKDNAWIREVNRATGVVTTIAGNGTAGYSGDNGQATAAELWEPSGVAVDAAGDLLIADTGNYRIREVASGINVTVNLPSTTTTVDASSTTYGSDGSVALTASVAANSPSTATVNEGSVTFSILSGGSTVAVYTSATVANGTASDSADLAALGTSAGVYSISAVYNPAATDPDFQSSSSLTPGQLTINKAPLTVTAEDQSKVYGGTDPTLTYIPSGTLYYTDTYSVVSGVVLSTTTGSAATAGTHPITATGGTAANYTITFVPGTLTVSPAPLTVTADNKSKVCGGTDPSLTYTPSGTLYYGDQYSVISGVVLSTATGAAATVGTHPITATGGTAANYTITDVAGTLTVSDPWVFAGKGAFNGPGTTDMLWFNEATGDVEAWKMSNGAVTGGLGFGYADPSQWKVLGIADFTGQGTDDILWLNQNTGLVGAWLISNGAVTGWAAFGPVDLSQWQFAGIGKFKGSSNPADVLWFNQTSGYVVSWIIQNAAVTSGPVFGTADPSTWKVVGVGNFEDNGTDDILWQNQNTGIVGAWVISNAAVTGWDNLGPADPSTWKLIAVGDLGNGTPDLVWQNQSTNLVGAWIINNGAVTGWAGFGPADPSQWQVLGAGNLTGHSTGTADVLWRNLSSGLVESWIIQGGAVVGASILGGA